MTKEIKKEKYKKYLFIFVFILVIGILLYTIPEVIADVGNNNRYESTSSTEYTSSSSDDFEAITWLIWLLFECFGPLPGLVILALFVFIFMVLKKNGRIKQIKQSIDNVRQNINNINQNSINTVVYKDESIITEEIRTIDPVFSKDAFIGWVREVFIKIQTAWTARDWKVIRPFESNELFSQHSLQLQEYINNNKINIIEKININTCVLREFKQDGDKEVIVVELHAIMRDYVVDANTRKVLESDPNKDWYMKYLMTFNRKSGVKTKEGTSNKSTTNCPNCGAPTDITSSGQCNYCDSIITTGEHDWVLSDIRAIK